jgi:LacI family transcriptional regulator
MKKNNSPRPTQMDIARSAGVSQSTVSQVLNRAMVDSIPKETRQRVQDAIDSLGYVPDRTARSLRTKKTYTLAAIIPDITNPFYPTFIRGVQDVAESYDYDLVIYNTDGDKQKEYKCLQSVRQNNMDGLIAVLFHPTADHLAALGIPVAHFQLKPVSPPLVDVIFIDNCKAAREMVDYLIGRGHRSIGMISGGEHTHHNARVLGYRQSLEEHNIPILESLIRCGNYHEEGGYRGMRELLSLSPRPSAVFVSNDLMALGSLVAVREAGLRVPEDIAIAGFDDIPAARLVDPPLTTINQFQDKIGRRAAEMLFERIHGKAPEAMRSVEMSYQLFIRKST